MKPYTVYTTSVEPVLTLYNEYGEVEESVILSSKTFDEYQVKYNPAFVELFNDTFESQIEFRERLIVHRPTNEGDVLFSDIFPAATLLRLTAPSADVVYLACPTTDDVEAFCEFLRQTSPGSCLEVISPLDYPK